MSAENRTRGSGKSTGEGHSAGTAPSRARTRPGMSPAAAELSGLHKPACPQPHSPSPARPRAGKGEVAGIRIPLGQEQQQEQGTKGWLLLGAAGGSGEEQSWAWHKPCPWCSCRAKLSGNSLEGSREGPVEAEGAAVLAVLSFPLHCHVPRRSRACLGSATALLPLLQGTVSICFGSALEAAPGSGSDETCPGKPLPREGWGYPAQAAFWSSSSPGCCPPAPSKPIPSTP